MELNLSIFRPVWLQCTKTNKPQARRLAGSQARRLAGSQAPGGGDEATYDSSSSHCGMVILLKVLKLDLD